MTADVLPKVLYLHENKIYSWRIDIYISQTDDGQESVIDMNMKIMCHHNL